MGRSEDGWAKGKWVWVSPGENFYFILRKWECSRWLFFFLRFFDLFLAPLGFCRYAQAFFGCSEWGLPHSWAVQASHCGVFPCCEGGLQFVWAQQLRYMGLLAP